MITPNYTKDEISPLEYLKLIEREKEDLFDDPTNTLDVN
jgi:hypothetical protein